MQWTIRYFPPCSHHVFLSHCREDYDDLVYPTYLRLRQQRIIPWLDRHDYPYGSDSRLALQDGILRSRNAVFFITPHLLNNPRGWCALELAYGTILQNNLAIAGGALANVILPLFLVSPWRTRDYAIYLAGIAGQRCVLRRRKISGSGSLGHRRDSAVFRTGRTPVPRTRRRDPTESRRLQIQHSPR